MIEPNWQEIITSSLRGEMGSHTVNAADEGAVRGEGRIISSRFFFFFFLMLKALTSVLCWGFSCSWWCPSVTQHISSLVPGSSNPGLVGVSSEPAYFWLYWLKLVSVSQPLLFQSTNPCWSFLLQRGALGSEIFFSDRLWGTNTSFVCLWAGDGE